MLRTEVPTTQIGHHPINTAQLPPHIIDPLPILHHTTAEALLLIPCTTWAALHLLARHRQPALLHTLRPLYLRLPSHHTSYKLAKSWLKRLQEVNLPQSPQVQIGRRWRS